MNTHINPGKNHLPMRGRAFRVTLLLWLVLIFTAFNALRAWTALAWNAELVEFSTTPGPIFTAVSGMIWVAIGAFMFFAIWTQKPWARLLLMGSNLVYITWYWIERLVWQEPRPNWLFALILQIVLTIFITVAGSTLLKRTHDRRSQNQEIN